MEINFFGLLDVTRKAMEVFRDQQKPMGGLVQQITSIGGQRGVPFVRQRPTSPQSHPYEVRF
jgi:hypothetical protein